MVQVRRIAVAIVIAIFCAPAFSADPLTLLLLRMIRDKIISAGLEATAESAGRYQAAPPPDRRLPGLHGPLFAGFDESQLRRLIDEGFLHLTPAQRDEVFASVRRIIADPKNAADVPAIIAELAMKASAVRQAHEQINSLSFAEKQRIANEAREEYARMPVETREQMASVLRQRLVPLPSDLTDMILAEFDRVRAQTATSAQAPVTAATSPAPLQPQDVTAAPAN